MFPATSKAPVYDYLPVMTTFLRRPAIQKKLALHRIAQELLFTDHTHRVVTLSFCHLPVTPDQHVAWLQLPICRAPRHDRVDDQQAGL